MSLQKGSRSQTHTRAGAKWDNCTGITRKPLHILYYDKKATGYMCASTAVTHRAGAGRCPHHLFTTNIQQLRTQNLLSLKEGGVCTQSQALLFWQCEQEQKCCYSCLCTQKVPSTTNSLKPFGDSLLKSGGSVLVYLTLKCCQQKPSSHWGNTATGKVISRSSSLLKSVSGCPTRWHS